MKKTISKITINNNLICPSYFTLTNKGEILILDECTNELHIFKDNRLLKTIKVSKNSITTSFSISENLIIITDRFSHKIKTFSFDGKPIWESGGYGTEKGKLKEPYGLYVEDEKIYVSEFGNSRISVFDKNGKFITYFGKKGIEKQYYETDSFKNKFIFKHLLAINHKFSTIDTNFFEAGFSLGTLDLPKGIAKTQQLIAVCDYSGRIQFFNEQGKPKKTISKIESPLLSHPQWIANINGELFFSQELDNTIYKITNDFKITEYFKFDKEIDHFQFFNGKLYILSTWEKTIFEIS